MYPEKRQRNEKGTGHKYSIHPITLTIGLFKISNELSLFLLIFCILLHCTVFYHGSNIETDIFYSYGNLIQTNTHI